MENLDINEIMKVMSDPGVGTNMEKILGGLDKMNEVMGKFDKTMTMLDKMGIKPMIVRAIGKQLDIDVESPLKSESKEIVVRDVERVVTAEAASPTHEAMFLELNKLTEFDLQKQIAQMKPDDVKAMIAEVENDADTQTD